MNLNLNNKDAVRLYTIGSIICPLCEDFSWPDIWQAKAKFAIKACTKWITAMHVFWKAENADLVTKKKGEQKKACYLVLASALLPPLPPFVE